MLFNVCCANLDLLLRFIITLIKRLKYLLLKKCICFLLTFIYVLYMYRIYNNYIYV